MSGDRRCQLLTSAMATAAQCEARQHGNGRSPSCEGGVQTGEEAACTSSEHYARDTAEDTISAEPPIALVLITTAVAASAELENRARALAHTLSEYAADGETDWDETDRFRDDVRLVPREGRSLVKLIAEYNAKAILVVSATGTVTGAQPVRWAVSTRR
eukprot:6205510-Pleurochrysis_carterae.AAC.2